ncbi:hypothetical protein BD410DRAFT_842224 [Rickenella mellea]|uniref:Uncharacterized protein n=1 Tax=Rickenella mellea TaxID=50990 RepID=A0A4Y7PV92_9AGAM|nr:hypothetical protein BD410DRAFT_842224 [Rickenella mellea]
MLVPTRAVEVSSTELVTRVPWRWLHAITHKSPPTGRCTIATSSCEDSHNHRPVADTIISLKLCRLQGASTPTTTNPNHFSSSGFSESCQPFTTSSIPDFPHVTSTSYGTSSHGQPSPTLAFHSIYAAYLRSVHATEHIVLSFIRLQDTQAPGNTSIPSRLKSWIKGYPGILVPLQQFDHLRTELDLNESARNVRLAQRKSLILRFTQLSTTLHFDTQLKAFTEWLNQPAEMQCTLKRGQKALHSFGWDTSPVMGDEEVMEDSFMDVFYDPR